MPGMDLSVTTRLSPSPRDGMSPALAIALPMMKSVNIVPAQCFDNMAYHSDKVEDQKETEKESKHSQESINSDNTVRVNNFKNESYDEKSIEDRTDARTPLLRDHKIESLDETKLRDTKVEKRKSSAST